MKCYICKKKFEYEGGFLLSPPVGDSADNQLCAKTDLCQKCYINLWQWIDEQNKLFKDIRE